MRDGGAVRAAQRRGAGLRAAAASRGGAGARRRGLRALGVAAALALGVLAAAAALGACNAPTIPLPPPAALVAEGPDGEGMVTVRGSVLAGAYVGVLNVRTERGVIVRADAAGAFEVRIEAAVGDTLQVWQQQGNDRGPLVELCVACSGASDR
jgi:hypothetical protein